MQQSTAIHHLLEPYQHLLLVSQPDCPSYILLAPHCLSARQPMQASVSLCSASAWRSHTSLPAKPPHRCSIAVRHHTEAVHGSQSFHGLASLTGKHRSNKFSQRRQESSICHASSDPEQLQLAAGGAINDDEIKMEVSLDENMTQIQYDEATKTVRIPFGTLQSDVAARRTKMVVFTCNKCGGRTARLFNPIAWEKGVVFGQCGTCEVWHVLSANNPKIYEEVRYKEDPRYADAPTSNGVHELVDSESS